MDKNKQAFPDHFIDPANKGFSWILQYTRAAWEDFNGINTRIFCRNEGKYDTIAEYLEGRQGINKYKPLMGIEGDSDKSWMNIDWSIFPAVVKLIRISLAILNKSSYKIRAKALDSLASSQATKHFNTQKSKILLRNAIEEAAPGMAVELGLGKLPNEASSIEELSIQHEYTWQHQMSIEISQMLSILYNINNVEEQKKVNRTGLLYYGVAGFKDYIDSDGTIKIKPINPTNMVVSFCRNRDFSDAIYIGEVREMSISELRESAQGQFGIDDLKDIAEKTNKLPTNNIFNQTNIDSVKVKVLDLEFKSVNDDVFKIKKDKRGNLVVYKDQFGRSSPEIYTRDSYEVIYKTSWIVGTDYMYNYGLATNMKRAKQDLSKVLFSYTLSAPVFKDMHINSIGNQVIPIIDQIQLDWLRLQQFKAAAKTHGYSIELGALEDISYAKGGEKMTPIEIIDLFDQKFVLLWRNLDPSGKEKGYKPIDILEFPGVEKAIGWFNSIAAHTQQLKDVIGLNDFTDASTPDPRSLTTTAEMAMLATNNSLYELIEAEKDLLKRLSESVILRIQDLAEGNMLGKYEMAIGTNSIDFFKVNPNVSNHTFGIELVKIPTDQEREELIQDAKALFGGDLVSFDDLVMIKNTDDLGVAEQLLAYRIKKRRDAKIQESKELQRDNAEVQMASATNAEEEKRKTLMLEFALNATIEDLKSKASAADRDASETAKLSSNLIQQYFSAALNSQQQQ